MTSRGGTLRPNIDTELGPDLSDHLDSIKAESPKWTLKGRPKREQVQGSWVPAPGYYRNPSTLSKSHPTLPCSGRGWHWGSEDRSKTSGLSPNACLGQDPLMYQPHTCNSVLEKFPSWSLKQRSGDTPVPYKGDLWCSANKIDKSFLYNTSEMKAKGGRSTTPKWTIKGRSKVDDMVPKCVREAPGPGAHDVTLAALKRQPSWGFGSAARF
eukprot:CAMPEP_0179030056 /NCGR_PEP_ID=MMETSP0796-20121207/10373_1 /TAXON_ID=73915 /ORGANISM="Pyrodinium bahamense, Strain pbaha01" /LENGTH=210 /DNA_ID=CAMNT_0020726235 /DNA_START=24 /DNA_END=653 /DNA_ORIENTATION=+